MEPKKIVLGVSGGIAAYKALEIVRRIKDRGDDVTVVMTEAATKFVQPLTFQTLSERPVATSMFSLTQESQIGHIKVGQDAHAILVAPATANIIAKAAHGIADDYLSTVLLACDAPLFIAPAMNVKMWEHPAVQHNLDILRQRGATVILPESGFLACGTYGAGRMTSVEKIVAALKEGLDQSQSSTKSKAQPLAGIKVLVTAGPTQEKIDAVRYLTNFSSGKMGYALAAHCNELGADVYLVSGPTSLAPPENVHMIYVRSAEEMYKAVMDNKKGVKLIIKAAAVSDYSVDNPNPHKIKKKDTLTLKLTKNRDILKELGAKKTEDQYLVGFAAESQDVETYARKKLKEKNLDLIVANNILQPDAGFDVDTNRVFLIDQAECRELPLMSKEEVGKKILDKILSSEKWCSIM